MSVKPPKNEKELLQRAQAIAGLSFMDLARCVGGQLPEKLLHGKGQMGQLLELALGATAGVKSEPDFQAIGVELKSIPVNARGRPKESTYVCRVPLHNISGLQWHHSKVFLKLSRVLWFPIEAEPSIAIKDRRLGMPILWSPSAEQASLLQQDWEEHMERITLGEVESITAHMGQVLQIRPKAADSHARRKGVGQDGEVIATLPRGFYLRPSFTNEILQQAYIT